MKWMAAVVLVLAACGGGRLDAPFPRAGASVYDRIIARQVPEGRLPDCGLPAVLLLDAPIRRPVQVPQVSLPIPRTWEFMGYQVDTGDRVLFLNGLYGAVWYWPGGNGIGFRRGVLWIDHRMAGTLLSPLVFQLSARRGYLDFAPGPYRMAELRECGDWAGENPVRVLLFDLVADDTSPERFYGLSAFWRSPAGSYVSLLGIGGHREARNEFLAMIRQSR